MKTRTFCLAIYIYQTLHTTSCIGAECWACWWTCWGWTHVQIWLPICSATGDQGLMTGLEYPTISTNLIVNCRQCFLEATFLPAWCLHADLSRSPVSQSSPDISSMSRCASSSCSHHPSKSSPWFSFLSSSSLCKHFPFFETCVLTFPWPERRLPQISLTCATDLQVKSSVSSGNIVCCHYSMKGSTSVSLVFSLSGWFLMYSTPLVASNQPHSYVL